MDGVKDEEAKISFRSAKPGARSDVVSPAIDFNNSTAGEISHFILALLPQQGGTRKSSDSVINTNTVENLIRAMDLVKENLLAKHCLDRVDEAKESSLSKSSPFCNGEIELSEDVLVQVLEYCPSPTIVHGASLVNKTWNSVTKQQRLWKEMNSTAGFRCFKKGRKMSMEQFLSLVQRPQFASITSIVLPDQAKLGPDGLEQLAQACPLLKDIELGHENTSIKETDKQILSLPRLFPHLSTVGFNMINVTNRGICGFLRRMGPRLLEIKIRSISLLRSNMLWNDALQTAAVYCTNLEGFGYMVRPTMYIRERNYRPQFDITNTGIIALLTGCKQLKRLVLIGTKNVSFQAFHSVVDEGTTTRIGTNLEYLEFRVFCAPMDTLRLSVQDDEIRYKLQQNIAVCQWNRTIAPYLKLHPWECTCEQTRGCLCF